MILECPPVLSELYLLWFKKELNDEEKHPASFLLGNIFWESNSITSYFGIDFHKEGEGI